MGGEPGNLGKARGSYKLETYSSEPFAMGPVECSVEATELCYSTPHLSDIVG